MCIDIRFLRTCQQLVRLQDCHCSASGIFGTIFATSVEKMLRTSCVPVLLDQSLPQHVTQIRQHQRWQQHRRLRQQKPHRLVFNSAVVVVVDVVVLLLGQNLFAVRVGEEAEAQSGVLPMIQRWIMIWVVDIPWVGNEDVVVGASNDCIRLCKECYNSRTCWYCVRYNNLSLLFLRYSDNLINFCFYC